MNSKSSSTSASSITNQRRKPHQHQQQRRAKITKNNNNVSSSVSIEAPKGCLRFFVSHNSSPKKTNNSPKKHVHEKPILPKKKKNTALHTYKTSQNVKKPFLVSNSKCRSELDKENDVNLITPLSKDDNKGSAKAVTPPIEATVSPEIQCGLDIVSMAVTPVCYGAGHLLSGVADKRKCRPRGVLVVGEDVGRAAVLVPSPIEASMRWLLSPCKEDDENRNDGNLQFSGSLSTSLPSFGSGLTSSLRENSSGTSRSSVEFKSRKMSNGFSSPSGVREFQGFFRSHKDCKDNSLMDERRYCNDFAEENPLFSNDSPGSGNVMRTPDLESSSEKHVCYPWFTPGNCENSRLDSELGSPANFVQTMGLSTETLASVLDSMKLESQLDDHTMPSSSFDNLRLRQVLGNQVSWDSGYTSENMSLSQMRISWKEGMVSQIFDKDELDCCRYLSDEEEDPKSHQNQEVNAGGKDGESVGKEKCCPPMPCSCTESISSDGRELFASGDSDWSLCYKDRLYEV